jgi:hypothetical protein
VNGKIHVGLGDSRNREPQLYNFNALHQMKNDSRWHSSCSLCQVNRWMPNGDLSVGITVAIALLENNSTI